MLGRTVLSNVISSQIEVHRKWGGVVPEAAARLHVEAILLVIDEALATAGVGLSDISGFAATDRPGLIGGLAVGVAATKSLACAANKPYLGIHHLEGHLSSVFALDELIPYPHIALIASGGHTELVHVREFGQYELIGQTIDDAAGEAFDKASRLLGLGYPGGRAIQEAASTNTKRYSLPRGLTGDTIDFSFSGLKTAVLRLTEREGDEIVVADAAATVQEAIVSVLVERTMRAVERVDARAVALVGGVAANAALRERLNGECRKNSVGCFIPPLGLCTDNAAMIGLAASVRFARGEAHDLQRDVSPVADLS